MGLEIIFAILVIMATLLSIYFLEEYGISEKYTYLQISISLILVYFSKAVGAWWGIGSLICLGIALIRKDTLKKLSENRLFKFITGTFGNLIFVIDNLHNIVKGTLELIVVTVIAISIVLMIWLIGGYLYLLIKYIISKYKFKKYRF
ncbi:hypothetical protein OQL12_002494 [Clostridium perfringens]|uniref:hypothetical protein n=1 Tax=Clostridium TaxID=1485 RepID=UPI00016BD56C|nr:MULTISPECIES: hypothetical protein [Clostridium]EDT27318.1 hypothetical protein AC5_0172 [Clostridium perfringens CPE str. F4969]EGT0681550.1 hypothetical protein [Clostridium perfringens]MDH5070701.1 hypothetical protein [Clostridium perfringens]MDH5090472.1 hypothetical protein [Clostridium perfringens]MDU2094543.1 hypothetical protein [Clostridium perfringens]